MDENNQRKYAVLTNSDPLEIVFEKHNSLSALVTIPDLPDQEVSDYEQVVYQIWGGYHPFFAIISPRTYFDYEEVGLIAMYFPDGKKKWIAFSAQWINKKYLPLEGKRISPGSYIISIIKKDNTVFFGVENLYGNTIISTKSPQVETGKMFFMLGMEHYSKLKKWEVRLPPVKFSHIHFENRDGWDNTHLTSSSNKFKFIPRLFGVKSPMITNKRIEEYDDFRSWAFTTEWLD